MWTLGRRYSALLATARFLLRHVVESINPPHEGTTGATGLLSSVTFDMCPVARISRREVEMRALIRSSRTDP